MIRSFKHSLDVIQSKQHPRRLGIMGSDGFEYGFLLKGHEDLRQDERVMQLFGLINTLLAKDPETRRRDLALRVSHNLPLSVCIITNLVLFVSFENFRRIMSFPWHPTLV